MESGPDAGDASNVYAISDQKTHSKGLLIDAFDIFDEICDRGLAERLVENRYTEFVEDSDVPCRYGLRKVYKNEFDRDPERYVLRIGYPDFPECPFGELFWCSASTRLSRHMFGSSQVYSGICDRTESHIRARKFPITNEMLPAAVTDAQEASVVRPIERNEGAQGGNDGQEHHQRDNAFA